MDKKFRSWKQINHSTVKILLITKAVKQNVLFMIYISNVDYIENSMLLGILNSMHQGQAEGTKEYDG